MKFKITNSCGRLIENKTEQLTMNKYPKLIDYNYTVKTRKSYNGESVYDEYVTISSLEELIKLIGDCDYRIIIEKESNGDLNIEIYDGWRE